MIREALAPGCRVQLAAALGLGLAAGVCAVGQAVVLSRVINAVLLPNSPAAGGAALAALNPYLPELAGLLGLAALRAALVGGSEAAASHLAAEVKTNLRQRLLSSLVRRGPAGLRAEQTGELAGVFGEGFDGLEAYYAQYLPQLVFALSLPALMAAVIFRIDWLSGLILLLTGPLIPLFMVLIGDAGAALARRQWRTLSRMSAFFFDVLQGLPTLKMLGQSRRQAENIAKASQEHRRATLAVLRVTFLSAFVLELLSTLSVAVVAVQIGLRLLYGQMDFQPAFLILVLAPEYYLPLRLLALRFHAGAAGAAAGERILALLAPTANPASAEGVPSVSEAHRPAQSPLQAPEICFSDVTFAYPGGPLVLQHLSCCLPAGKITLLSGASGAGKSTLAGLLLGFWKLSSHENGALLIDGQPVSRLPFGVAWAPQRPYLFHNSVAENIRIAYPGASDAEVQQAARLAQADAFIRELPQGYQTRLGERGLRLSGGQAQRIALARAFLSPAPLLILDEPAASLDLESEGLVYQAIGSLAGRRTVLVITHRPGAFQRSLGMEAAQALWLEQGRIMQLPPDQPAGQQAVAEEPASASPPGGPLLGSFPFEPVLPDNSPNALRPALAFLLGLLAPFRKSLALAALLGFAAVASGAGLMSTAAYILSRAAWPASIADLQVAIVGVRFFGLGRAVFRYLERLATHGVTLNVLAALRLRIYRSLEPLAPAGLARAYHSGGLLSQLTGDISALEEFYVRAIAPPAAALLTGGAAFVFFSYFDIRLGLGLSMLLALNGVLLPGWAWLGWQRSGPQLVAARAELKIRLVDLLQGLPDLLVLGQAPAQARQTLAIAGQLDRLTLQSTWRRAWFNAGNIFLSHLAVWFVLLLAIPQVARSELSPLALGALALAALACFEAVQSLPQAGQQLAADQAAAGRLLHLLNQPPPVNEAAGQRLLLPEKPEDRQQAHLQIEDLRFTYPEPGALAHPPALDGLSLELRPGQMILLSGPSGAGKSTLINLLLRFWEFDQGSIRLNGSDVRQIRAEDVRRHFAVVTQRIHLFNASLRDNLRLAGPDAQDAELYAALRLAQLEDFVRALPDGLDTWLGEEGLRLSGGERQRLALARASLQNAPFLLLDEPTTHLDKQTARLITQSILALRQRCGIILITHHLEDESKDLLAEVDDWLVLDQGRLIER